MIASFKGKTFRVSSNQIYTFTGMTWGGSIDTEALEQVGSKPSTYIKGSNLDTMSFEIILRSDLGHNVRSEIESWESIRDSRSPAIFVLGTKQVGKNKWLLKSVTVNSVQIDSRGNLLSAVLQLEFEEYVRAGKPPEESNALGISDIGLTPMTIYNQPKINIGELIRDNPNADSAYIAYLESQVARGWS